MGRYRQKLGRYSFGRDAVRIRTATQTPGGSTPAPNDAQFLTLATDGDLTQERVFTPGDGLAGTDAGAGGAYTLDVDLVAAWSGLEFSGGDLRTDLDAAHVWTALHSFAAGITLNGASDANEITIPDNAAIAFELEDAGGLEYLRIVSTNAQPVIDFNNAAADVDFHVQASGVADAFQVQGSDGQITLGALGAGYVSASAGGVLSSAALPGSFTGFANPSANVGLAAVNGAATTAMRSDGAPALDQGIVPTWTGVHTFQNTGLHILDTNDSHDLIIAPGSNITADRTLTLTTGDASRTITLSGNPTLADWFDQSVKQAAGPTFADVFVPDGGTFGITGNELLTVKAAGEWVFTGSEVMIDPGGGLASSDGTLHVHRATAGAVVASGGADELIIENNSTTGMSFLGPDAENLNIYFGSPSDSVGAMVRWNYDALTMIIGPATAGGELILTSAGSTERMKIESGGNVVIGNPTAAAKLHVDQASSSAAIPVLYLDQGDASEQHIVLSMDGADQDFPAIIELAVTGSPAMWWDESESAIGFKNVAGVMVENGDWIGAGSGCAWLFDSGNGDITTGELVGIGATVPVNPVAQLHVVGAVASGLPVVILNQPDNSEEFINYIGNSAASIGNPISTWTTGNSIQGFVRVGINGAFYWMPYYDAPTS